MKGTKEETNPDNRNALESINSLLASETLESPNELSRNAKNEKSTSQKNLCKYGEVN